MCCKQREEYIVAKDLSSVHPELRQMAKIFPRTSIPSLEPAAHPVAVQAAAEGKTTQ
jgi:hypothetical protein